MFQTSTLRQLAHLKYKLWFFSPKFHFSIYHLSLVANGLLVLTFIFQLLDCSNSTLCLPRLHTKFEWNLYILQGSSSLPFMNSYVTKSSYLLGDHCLYRLSTHPLMIYMNDLQFILMCHGWIWRSKILFIIPISYFILLTCFGPSMEGESIS